MSSFFTTPASQRKRKRTEGTSVASRKRNVNSTSSQSKRSHGQAEREDSISGSGSSDEDRPARFDEEDDESGPSEEENETAAEKRLRLAERYLENIQEEVEDTIGFDAAEIDRDLIAERLVEDVAETKGKIYRTIADDLDFEGAKSAFERSGLRNRVNPVTGCAIHLPYAWTIGKDMLVEKWELVDPTVNRANDADLPTNIFPRRKPKRLLWKKGNKNRKNDVTFLGHTAPILSIAVSDSGKFLATGDESSRLIIWDAETLTPRKLFNQHRAAVTSLSFRRGTEQLFSASADRTIKIWSASELAYIETLFGHQDSVISIAGGLDRKEETCVSVGGRDRTARLWKVVEENQLVFRGGGFARHKGMEKLRKGRFGGKTKDDDDEEMATGVNGVDEDTEDDDPPISYAEGSIDCVAFLDAQLFVTGSDNGALSLWSVHKKKALLTLPLAHGRDQGLSPEQMSANVDAHTTGEKGPRLARYITSIATIPFADIILTGSWDGWIRAWRIGSDKRSIEPLGKIGQITDTKDTSAPLSGVVTGLAVSERGTRGEDGLCVVASVGTEPRLGRWMNTSGRDGVVVFEVTKKSVLNGRDHNSEEEEDE